MEYGFCEQNTEPAKGTHFCYDKAFAYTAVKIILTAAEKKLLPVPHMQDMACIPYCRIYIVGDHYYSYTAFIKIIYQLI